MDKTVKKFKVSAIALGIISFANIVNAQEITLQNVNQNMNLTKRVTDFSNQISYVLSLDSTQLYLKDEKFAASSTLPLKLFARIEKIPFQASPFLPITKENEKCYFGVPSYKKPIKYDINKTPINITADSVFGDVNESVEYEGNVVVKQADKTLQADKADYKRSTNTISAYGNVLYHDGQFTIKTPDRVSTNITNQVTNLQDGQFQLNGSVASGSVNNLSIDEKNKKSTIEEVTFSTCPINDRVWYLKAEDVTLDSSQSYGNAYNATMYVKDVPIFYMPYVTFPISNTRKSGLLYPSGSISTSSGFEYSQPIYLNLAPNYDYTLTPKLMTKRGLMLGNEFRYMPFENTKGSIILDYLPNDRQYNADNGSDRWLLQIDNTTKLLDNDLSFIVNYQQVKARDYNYLTDLGGKNIYTTDNSLVQSFLSTYDRPNYDLSLEYRRYQTLIPYEANFIRPFELAPNFKANYYQAFDRVYFNVNSSITNFLSPSSYGYNNSFNATRVHLEPSVDILAYSHNGTTFNTKFTGYYTHYNQDNLNNLPEYFKSTLGFNRLDSSVDRALYAVELHAKTVLQRQAIDLRHTQTLEPEILYRYIPYKNQDYIGIYDTTDRYQDYYTNFSSNYYSGIDRIADTNAFTFGFTSRLLDAHDREIYRLSVSQTVAIQRTRVTLTPNDPVNTNSTSPFAINFDISPTDYLTAHTYASVNTEDGELNAFNIIAEYKASSGLMTQVGYRYAKDGNRTINNNIKDLSQLGMQFKYPLSDNLSLIAASYRDLDSKKNIDSKVALRYDDCCYALTFMYENYSKADWENLRAVDDKIFGIQFELKGIGQFNVSGNNKASTTDTELIPYFNPISLNR